MTHTSPLPRSTPEAEGVDAAGVVSFVEAIDSLDSLHSLMILRHGRVIAEGWWHPYGPELPHSMFSVSKSFTSMAVGLAIEAGLLRLDDRLVELLPEDVAMASNPTPDLLAKVTVRHLLTMTTGHATDTVNLTAPIDGHWAAIILGQSIEFEPGTRFVYNSGATYLLSAIVQRLTGERLLDYLTPRILEPLGIVDATWESSPQGIDAGGWGLSITTEDLAAFGQLLLQGGEWEGAQLVPAEWIGEASSGLIDTSGSEHKLDGRQGYGYQFWRNSAAGYRADGAFGQFAIVLPDLDAVVAITAGLPEAQLALDLVWKHLVPAFTDAPPPELADIPAEDTDVLGERLSSLRVPVPAAEATPADGILGSTWHLDQGDLGAMTLTANTFTLTHGGSEEAFAFELGEWAVNESRRTAAAAGWSDPLTFELRLAWYETPFGQRIEAKFDGDDVRLTITNLVSFNENEQPRVYTGSR